MSFVDPAFLIGLLAAFTPLIVHLINRRKASRQVFPALKFLIQSNRRVARGAKIRKWLLLALRMLVVGLLAFALAKPFVSSSKGVSAEERLPTATVVVLDTSFSMGNAGWWDEALETAQKEIDDLRPWDEVAVVFADTGLATPLERLTTDHALATRALDDLQPGYQTTNLTGALRVAADLLAPTKLPNRRIVVISDFAQGGFPESAAGAVPVEIPVELVSVGTDDRASLAVVDVQYEQEGTRREPVFKVEATLQNFGVTDSNVEVRFLLDGVSVAAAKIAVPAGKTAIQTFRHRVEGMQAREGAVSIVAADQLAADDTRYFTLKGSDRVRTLLVNGEPAPVVYRDEMFFFERALNPKGAADTFVTTSVTREGLEGRDLNEFDVVVLANVTSVSSTAADALKTFVEGGGGLLIAMGSQVEVGSWNTQMASLLPKPLRGMKQLAEMGDPDAPVKITRFGNSRREHPIFEVFEAPGGATLQSGLVYSYMLLEPSPPEQSQTLLSFKDAAPGLLERRVGRGRVLLLTTTLDADWTDLPTRTSYLPLARRMVQYLARRATSQTEPKQHVGQPVHLDVDGLFKERIIVTLGERRVVLEPEAGKARWIPDQPGVWQVWADAVGGDGLRLDALDFAVNVDPTESALQPLPDGALRPWLATEGADGVTERTSEKRVNLWPIFLFMVTIGLLLESVLGTRRSVLVRIWRFVTRQPATTLPEEPDPSV